MIQNPSGIPALLAALQNQASIQNVLSDPWQFIGQFGITPQSLFAANPSSQLPGFNDVERNTTGNTHTNSSLTDATQ